MLNIDPEDAKWVVPLSKQADKRRRQRRWEKLVDLAFEAAPIVLLLASFAGFAYLVYVEVQRYV